MERIKICYVIVNCKITGPMNQTLNIIKNLNKDRYEVSFITLFDEEKNNSMIDLYLKECKNHYCLGLNRISSLVIGKKKLYEKLADIKPDVVHALGMPPYRLSLKYKDAKPLVTLRNYAYEDYPSYYNKLIGPILAYLDVSLIKKLHKKGNKFVTCSESLSNIYIEKEKLNLPYIRNGVDIEKYTTCSNEEKLNLREKLNLPKEKIIFIYTAPFNERKNQEFAIKSILNSKNQKDILLILCGDGTTLEELKQKYKEYENIIFTGKIKNIPEYLKASDVYFSTSKSEGLPNSVLEGMATGLSVILSDIPQHLEFFELNENIGYYYEQDNLKNVTDIIESLNSEKINLMGNNAYQTILNNLSSKCMSEKYQELYEEMIK
ncbi:MAG: glycosyltransferase family 4 protein [Clostridia bacterium]|nr:glycosyltransferase family 4 protein [Clostridia bacterium]